MTRCTHRDSSNFNSLGLQASLGRVRCSAVRCRTVAIDWGRTRFARCQVAFRSQTVVFVLGAPHIKELLVQIACSFVLVELAFRSLSIAFSSFACLLSSGSTDYLLYCLAVFRLRTLDAKACQSEPRGLDKGNIRIYISIRQCGKHKAETASDV